MNPINITCSSDINLKIVHAPYRPLPKIIKVTPTSKTVDFRYVYRVLHKIDSETLVDAVTVVSSGRDPVVKSAAIKLFYQGAEDDLDRFIYWFYYTWIQETSEVPYIVVVKQSVFSAVADVEDNIAKSDDPAIGLAQIKYVYPGCDYVHGILIDRAKYSNKPDQVYLI